LAFLAFDRRFVLEADAVQAIVDVLLLSCGDFRQLVLFPHHGAQILMMAGSAAPVVVVEVDVAVVALEEFGDDVGIVDARKGLDGPLLPEKHHRGDMGEDDGTAGDLLDELFGIGVIVPRPPGLLADEADEGQEGEPGVEEQDEDEAGGQDTARPERTAGGIS